MYKYVLFLYLLASYYSFSQNENLDGADFCSQKKINSPNLGSLFNTEESPKHSFDVLNYKLNLDLYNCFLSPFPKSFSGSVKVTFRVDSALNSITLNAVNTSLVVDSVKIAGISFTHASNILTINLNRTYLSGEVTDVLIYYKHNNVTDNAFYATNGIVFTDCQPEGARKWFPCWDKPSDKATLDLTAKVPATVKLGSNGRLADSIRVADTIYYNWISRDPISTYLMVMTGRVNYNLDIVHWTKLSNPNEKIPIRFYWNSGENTTNLNNIKTKILPMTDHFSNLFGEYPFEKNGFATIGTSQFTWGGMENQTLTSLCSNCWNSETLIAHEHAHQWFGDMISPGTWADLWLNEGFATYGEALWLEYSGGYTSYKNKINSAATQYLGSNPGWPIYNPSWAVTTPPTSTLFNTAITYNKGACVLHMLRYTLGDSLFFHGIKKYATDSVFFMHKSAVTEDFISRFSNYIGQDISWFSNQWIYQPNHPAYQNTYNFTSLGGGEWMVGFRARQTQSNPPFFKMPLEIKITFASGPDTLIRVMNDVNNQSFGFRFNRQPLTLQFDPSNHIVLKSASLSVGNTLSAPVLSLPENGLTNQPTSLPLIWSETAGAATYHIQVSTDSIFSTIQFSDSTLTNIWYQLGNLNGKTRYFWRVRAKNSGGTSAWSEKWTFTTSNQTSAKEELGIPDEYSLFQNYPNPFNPETVINYHLPVNSYITLKIFNVLGEEVATLLSQYQPAGKYTVNWNASSLNNGVYFYRLIAGPFVQTKKLILIK